MPGTTPGTTRGAPLLRRHSFLDALTAAPQGVAFSALKKADKRDAVILRVFNPGADAIQVTLAAADSTCAVYKTNLREERQDRVAIAGGLAGLSLGPRKIVTMELPSVGGCPNLRTAG